MEKTILDYLQQNEGWHTKGSLYILAEKEGYSFEYLGRLCRTLAEEGKINVDYYTGKRGQKLVKYSRKDTPKPQIQKKVYKEIDGTMYEVVPTPDTSEMEYIFGGEGGSNKII